MRKFLIVILLRKKRENLMIGRLVAGKKLGSITSLSSKETHNEPTISTNNPLL